MSAEAEPTEESAEESGGINLILRQRGEEIILRQIALGFQPLVLIEPDLEVESITVDATEIGPHELADMFELLAELLRKQFGITPVELTTEEND